MTLSRRYIAVPALLSAVVLAGCGSSGSSGSSAATQTPYQIIAASAKKTTTTNARLLLNGSVSAAGQSFPLKGTGAYDFVNHRGTISLSVPQAGTIESRIIGTTIYEKLPANLSAQSGRKPWLKVDLNAVSKSMGGSGQLGTLSQSSDPTQVLKYLQGSSQSGITTVGKETVKAGPATHYKAQIDIQKAVQQGAFGQATADTFKKEFGTTAFPIDVWIDDEGRAVKTSYSLKAPTGAGSFTFAQELYDFGKADVGTLVAPPADQTQDISKLAGTATGATG